MNRSEARIKDWKIEAVRQKRISGLIKSWDNRSREPWNKGKKMFGLQAKKQKKSIGVICN